MLPTYTLQGGLPELQGGNTQLVQDASRQLQSSNSAAQTLQPNVSPMGATVAGVADTPTQNLNLDNAGGIDPLATQRAADAAKAAQLRGNITNLIQQVKDVFNSRYGSVDAAAADASGRRNEQYNTESGDIASQAADAQQGVGAAAASAGTYDSSYRANNQDTVARESASQIRDLGTELQSDLGKIGGLAANQKGGFDASKGALDIIASRLAESTDPAELTTLRSQLEQRIQELQAGGSEYNTQQQNLTSLNSIVPTNPRAVQLKTTLGKIIASASDQNLKASLGTRVIQGSGLPPEEQQKLMQAFQGDLGTIPEDQLTA